jgi:glycosyltransferase involved in cell wall biosynthesis
MAGISRIIITGPSLDPGENIGGISAVASFVINNNKSYNYIHFELGKHDNEKRSVMDLFRVLKGWLRWFSLLVADRGSLIHFNIALEKRSLLRDTPLLLFSRLLGKRMIIHIHGGLYLNKEEMPRWIKSAIRSVLSGNEPKIVLSSDEQKLVSERFQARNVFVLPNSLDISEAREFKRIWHNTGPVRLLFISRIVKAKGIESILQALKALRELDMPFKFLMAGDGEDKDEYIRKFSGILGSDFVYKGVVSGKMKTSLLKECNIFLLPSLYEGLPVSLLECMSYALVPIVTDVGSIKNVITDGYNGIIVGKNSHEDISNAIIRLINKKELFEQLGMNAQAYIFKNFNPDDYLKKLNEIYSLT